MGGQHRLGRESSFQRSVWPTPVWEGLLVFPGTSGLAHSSMSQPSWHCTQKQSFLNPASGSRPKWKHLLAHLAFNDNTSESHQKGKAIQFSLAEGAWAGGDHLEAEYRRACYLAGPFSPTNQPVLFLLPIKMFHTTLDSVFSIRLHLTLAPKPTELTTKKSRKPPYLRGGCHPRGEPHLFSALQILTIQMCNNTSPRQKHSSTLD